MPPLQILIPCLYSSLQARKPSHGGVLVSCVQKWAAPYHVTDCMWRTSRGGCGLAGDESVLLVFSSLDFLLVQGLWMGVCVCPLYLLCCMITLVFLQVLEPFCPLSEQESSDLEEVEVIQPASSATELLPSQTKLNPCSLPSDSSATAPKDLSCSTVLTETIITPVPLTAIPAASFSDTDAGLPLPSFTSDPQPHSGSASPGFNSLSDSQSGAPSVEDDSTLSDPPDAPPFTDIITIHPSKIPADESSCSPTIM